MIPMPRRANAVALSESINASPAELIGVVKEFGFAGVIAKPKGSYYESGTRSGAWSKYNVNKGQEFVIGGYTSGNPLDAVIVGYSEGDQLHYAAKMRNGFVPRLRRVVWQKLKGLETATCPFANLREKKRSQWALTGEEMKKLHLAEPKLWRRSSLPNGHRMVTCGILNLSGREMINAPGKLCSRGSKNRPQHS